MDNIKFREVVLQRARLFRANVFDRDIIQFANLEIEPFVDEMLNASVIRMSAVLLKESLHDAKYPSDWWQAVKDRWLPKHVKRLFPVKYTVLTIEAYYPSIPVEQHESYKIIRVKYNG